MYTIIVICQSTCSYYYSNPDWVYIYIYKFVIYIYIYIIIYIYIYIYIDVKHQLEVSTLPHYLGIKGETVYE